MRGHRVTTRPAIAERTTRLPVPVVLDLRRAACAGHPAPQLWDRTVDGETKTQRAARKASAAAICSRCPERTGCPSMVRTPAQRKIRAKTTTPQVTAQLRCPECGTGFVPRDKRQRFCATRQPSCRHAHKNRERTQRRAADRPALATECPCGAELTAEQQQRRIKYHDPECRRLAANRRAAAYYAAHPAPARPRRRCDGPDCAVEFVPLTSRHRYHDPDCRGRALAANSSPAALPAVRCVRCTVEFVPRDPRHRYHDPRCARAHANELRKARYQAAVPPVPPVDRQAVLAVIHGQAPLTSLPHPHRWLPVRYLRRRRDLSVRLIAQQVQAGPTTVQRILARAA